MAPASRSARPRRPDLRDRGRPVRGAAVDDRPGDPGRSRRRRGSQPPKRRSKHDAIRSRVTDDQPRRGRRGHQPGPAHPVHPVDLPNVPGNAIQLAAGARIARVRRRQRQGARRRPRVARLRPADRARHEAGRREARHARRLSRPARLRGHRAQGRRRGRRASDRPRMRPSSCSSRATPSCCTSARRRAPAGCGGGRHGRHQPLGQRRGGVLRAARRR